MMWILMTACVKSVDLLHRAKSVAGDLNFKASKPGKWLGKSIDHARQELNEWMKSGGKQHIRYPDIEKLIAQTTQGSEKIDWLKSESEKVFAKLYGTMKKRYFLLDNELEEIQYYAIFLIQLKKYPLEDNFLYQANSQCALLRDKERESEIYFTVSDYIQNYFTHCERIYHNKAIKCSDQAVEDIREHLSEILSDLEFLYETPLGNLCPKKELEPMNLDFLISKAVENST
jgi:hypothetical protein